MSTPKKPPSARVEHSSMHTNPPAADSTAHVDTAVGRMRCAVVAGPICMATLDLIRASNGCSTCTAAAVAAMLVAKLSESQNVPIDSTADAVAHLAEQYVTHHRRHVATGPETLQ